MKRFRFYTSAFLFIGLIISFGSVVAETLVLRPDGPTTAGIEFSLNSREAIILEFSFRSVEVDSITTSGKTWTTISIPGIAKTSKAGYPEFPQVSAWVPMHNETLDWEILELDSVTMNVGPIAPAPELMQRANNIVLPRTPALQFYSGSNSYPESPVQIIFNGTLRNQKLALITINPAKTNPVTGLTTFYTNIRVNLRGSGGSLDELSPNTAANLSLMRAMNIPDISPPANQPESRLLVITVPEFDDAIAPLIDWKNRCGISTEIVHYSTVAQTADQLRDFIAEYFESAEIPPEFLLIVGDVTDIPAFYGVNLSLTDHPYSTLVGVDYLPDISVGRLSCGSPAECSQWVERILNYERSGQVHWNMSATVFSSSAAIDPQHGVTISNLFTSRGLNVSSLQQPQSGTLPLLMNSLNSGPEWVFYIGHGYSQSWLSVNPSLQNTQLPNVLQSSSSVIVSVACATADLDYPGASLGEAWTSGLLENGALAYFGATESTAFFYSDTIGIAALRGVFEHEFERLGTATDYGKLMCAQYFPQPSGGITEETIQQFVLLGDPSMRVYSSAPLALDVQCSATVPVGTTSIPVFVNMNGLPLANADVCITRSNGTTFCETSSESGLALIDLTAMNPTTFDLTVTARNAIPWMSEIHVVPVDGPFVSISGWELIDDTGDSDNEFDRGETVQLRLQLSNDGNAATSSGTILLNCSHPNVEIINGTADLSDLPPGESIWVTGSFSLSAGMQVQDATTAIIECSFTAGNYTSESFLPVPLHAPVIEVIESVMAEDSGDGDGNPEAGERLRLDLSIKNAGSDRADSLFVQLNGAFDYIQIQETAVTLPFLESGETAVATFIFNSDPATPRGYIFEYNYQMSSTNVLAQFGWGAERIGLIPVLLYELDDMPGQITGIEASLFSLGIEYERRLNLPADLGIYKSIWIFCGVSPNQRALPEQDAVRLAQFLDNGGSCYWEGGDVWAFNVQTSLNPYFHIIGLSDGTSNAGPIEGEFGSSYSEYSFEYNGENSFIDQLGAGSGANVILRNDRPNADYVVCISFAGGNYRTIGSSIEIGSLADGIYPSSRVRLIRNFLEWFGIESRMDVFAPVIQHVPISRFYQQNVPIYVSADIQDASGIESAELHYRLNGGVWSDLEMTLTDGMYRSNIPGVVFGTQIEYKFRAVDSSPMSNADYSETFSFDVVQPHLNPVELADVLESPALVKPRIQAPEGTAWSMSRNTEGYSIIELQGRAGNPISYVTTAFDGTELSAPEFGFWSRLRSSNTDVSIARVLGSTDGGISFPHVVWERRGGIVLESGYVLTDPQDWVGGAENVVLKFEYRGDAYWQLGTITLFPSSRPKSIPVEELVIQPEGRVIRLSWKENPNAIAYAVLASTQSQSPEFSLLSETAQTSFIDLSAEYSDMKYYRVKALLDRSDSRSLESAKVKPVESNSRDQNWNRRRR